MKIDLSAISSKYGEYLVICAYEISVLVMVSIVTLILKL